MFEITFDRRKRAKTLRERGLDFADAAIVFDGITLDDEDMRFDYGEERTISVGVLRDRVVVIVWTEVDANVRRIISMRHANGDEAEAYWDRVAQG